MTNEEIITCFYNAFALGDAESMAQYYHDDVVFTDPAFGTIKGDQAKAIWKMLIERSNGNIDIQYNDVIADSDTGSAKWTAKYQYGPHKRNVTNHVAATFEFKNGKIIAHTDRFDIWKWSRQALGTTGVLLGWSSFMKNKIQKTTNSLLNKYTKSITLLLFLLMVGLSSCKEDCVKDTKCSEQLPPGNICQAYWESWLYNQDTKECEYKGYSGCSPIGFESEAECNKCDCDN